MTTLHIVIAAVVVAVLLMQIVPRLSAGRLRGREALALDRTLDGGQGGADRLLYFWSPRCSMCRSMTPIIDELRRSRGDVISINVGEHPDRARDYRVLGTPTLVRVRGGKVDEVVLGAVSERRIREMLD